MEISIGSRENKLLVGLMIDAPAGPRDNSTFLVDKAGFLDQLHLYKSFGFSFFMVPSSELEAAGERQLIPGSLRYLNLLRLPMRSANPAAQRCGPNDKCLSPDSGCSAAISERSREDRPLPEVLLKDVDDRPCALLPYSPRNHFEVARAAVNFCDSEGGNLWAQISLDGIVDQESGCLSTCSQSGRHMESADASPEAATQYFHDLMSSSLYHPRIYAALALPPNLADYRLRRDHWVSEPVDCVIISSAAFVSDELHPETIDMEEWHNEFLRKLICLNRCAVLLQLKLEELDGDLVQRYVQLLKSRYADWVPAHRARRSDRLYGTMQPLHHNLSSQDYSGFETDIMKYELYERAICEGMKYLRTRRRNSNNPEDSFDQPEFVVAVLGCGGGPLVDRTIAAAAAVSARVRVYAVDKNPTAVALVQDKQSTAWKGVDVKVVSSDMRNWIPSEPLDIIVHEMLGCFADDECCPECLSEPQRHLRPDGLSIPSEYTNYLMPVSSTRLYGEIMNKSSKLLQQMQAFSTTQFDFLGFAREIPVFTFRHGPKTAGCGSRSCRLDYMANTDGLLHGFVGSFVAKLFGDITLCTLIGQRTPGMYSWNPVFFPLIYPVSVRESDRIQFEFSRQVGTDSVWYEWQLNQPKNTRIHNFNGTQFCFSLVVGKNGKI